jgi:hypothetical protein
MRDEEIDMPTPRTLARGKAPTILTLALAVVITMRAVTWWLRRASPADRTD